LQGWIPLATLVVRQPNPPVCIRIPEKPGLGLAEVPVVDRLAQAGCEIIIATHDRRCGNRHWPARPFRHASLETGLDEVMEQVHEMRIVRALHHPSRQRRGDGQGVGGRDGDTEPVFVIGDQIQGRIRNFRQGPGVAMVLDDERCGLRPAVGCPADPGRHPVGNLQPRPQVSVVNADDGVG